MQRTANENAACKRRICKRSDQPKIDRIANNDAISVSALHHCLLFKNGHAFSTNIIFYSHSKNSSCWQFKLSTPGGGGGGVLDISLGGEVRSGPSYPDPV